MSNVGQCIRSRKSAAWAAVRNPAHCIDAPLGAPALLLVAFYTRRSVRRIAFGKSTFGEYRRSDARPIV
jgi:hypothetical protein